jgi:AcrR family transcriptional regulator
LLSCSERGPVYQRCRDRILATGCHLLALHGLRNLRICDLAIAMNISSAAIRFHFADLDALLIEILHEHFKKINEAIGTIELSETERGDQLRQQGQKGSLREFIL